MRVSQRMIGIVDLSREGHNREQKEKINTEFKERSIT